MLKIRKESQCEALFFVSNVSFLLRRNETLLNYFTSETPTIVYELLSKLGL